MWGLTLHLRCPEEVCFLPPPRDGRSPRVHMVWCRRLGHRLTDVALLPVASKSWRSGGLLGASSGVRRAGAYYWGTRMFESLGAVDVEDDRAVAAGSSEVVAAFPFADWGVAPAADGEGSPVQVDGDDPRFEKVAGWPHVCFATAVGDGY